MTQPIKRSMALMPLSREHHFDLLLAWKIRKGLKKGVEAERIAAYIQYLNENLISLHFRDEETLLFNELPAEDTLCQRAREEHHEIKAMIVEICDKHKKNIDLFNNFADLIEAHVRYEERDLFPYIEEKLSIEKLKETEDVITRRHDVFVETWPDEFWGEK